VKKYVIKTLFIGTACNFLDALITIQIGIIKGVGMQFYATLAYLICFYLISVPNTFLFCFTLQQGLKGLWEGLIVG
jgi:Na+-driven multidrug efflux pump